LKARPSQLPPPGDWIAWLILTGRGWGKTRCGAEWIRSQVMAGCSRLALVGATAADVRDIMVEGESGILAISPSHDRPEYQPGLRRLTWKNGAMATCFSADEPDRLRGPQHDGAWGDEIASWRYPDAWDQLMFGLRIGRNPRVVATTTPRPVKLIRNLLAREGKDVVVTRGRTIENVANLAPAFLTEIMWRYEGTRLGRQELDAEVLQDVPGALWQREWIDRDRVAAAPELRRIVVAIDPAMSTSEGSDETGIVVAGVGGDDHGYVVDDLSGRYAPHEWAACAIEAYRRHDADRIVAEVNAGGEGREWIHQGGRGESRGARHGIGGQVPPIVFHSSCSAALDRRFGRHGTRGFDRNSSLQAAAPWTSTRGRRGKPCGAYAKRLDRFISAEPNLHDWQPTGRDWTSQRTGNLWPASGCGSRFPGRRHRKHDRKSGSQGRSSQLRFHQSFGCGDRHEQYPKVLMPSRRDNFCPWCMTITWSEMLIKIDVVLDHQHRHSSHRRLLIDPIVRS
jgi:phage terminase large subunit-like protein